MAEQLKIHHYVDDFGMGGVTRALKNFEHATLTQLGTHRIVNTAQAPSITVGKHDIAVVHFTANWRKLGHLLRLRYRCRYQRIILIEHSYTEGFATHEVANWRRFARMLRHTYALADTVVAVSRAQRRWIVESGLAPAEKVIAIPQSRNCETLLKLAPIARRAGPLRIGAFGRFHKQKGFDLLLQAMARVPVHVASLHLAGDGPDQDHLRALAARSDHVSVCAPFASPDRFLQQCDVVAIPSRWEAFGLVGVEARAAGRPILAARIDGLIDQIGADAFPHAPNCVGSIVRAIYKASAATDLRQRGLHARRTAASEFDNMISAWASLLAA